MSSPSRELQGIMAAKPSEAALSPDQLRASIAAGKIGPLYVIQGTDEVLKSELANLFSEAIEPELRAFNVDRLYASDSNVTPDAIVEAARTMPMMAPRRIVVVLQAEKVLTPKRESESGDEALAPLVEYIEKPVESAVLVFVTQENLDGKRRLTKLVRKHAAVVDCGDVGSDGQARRAIETQARDAGMILDRAAVSRLIHLATVHHENAPDTIDSAKLRTDTERVLAFVGQGTANVEHVNEVAERVEKSTRYGLTNAIERCDARTALRELRLRLDDGDNAFAILGQIAWAIRRPDGRMAENRLRPAVDALFRTDAALKSSGGNPRMLLERLVIELCG